MSRIACIASLLLALGVALAACAPAAAPSPTAAPTAAPKAAEPTKPAAPAAPAATSAPAATAAPAQPQTGALQPNQFAGKTLNIALPPGHIDNFKRLIGNDFEKITGAKLQLTGARSADEVARLRTEKSRPTLDIVWIDLGEAELMGREGLVAKVSDSEIPNIKNVRDNAKRASGIAPISFYSVIGFLYNTEIVKNSPPKSWKELWDPRFKNQIAMFDMGSTVGVAALVIAAQINGGGENNIDPGFKAIKDLKPNTVGYRSSGPENNNLVAQGEAGVTFALASQMQDLKKNGAKVDWLVPQEGAIGSAQGFQVVANSPEPAMARALVNYALSKEIQTRFANDLLYSVVNKDVTVDPKAAPFVPLDKLIFLDFDALGTKRAEWTNRFNREILGG